MENKDNMMLVDKDYLISLLENKIDLKVGDLAVLEHKNKIMTENYEVQKKKAASQFMLIEEMQDNHNKNEIKLEKSFKLLTPVQLVILIESFVTSQGGDILPEEIKDLKKSDKEELVAHAVMFALTNNDYSVKEEDSNDRD